MTSDAFIVTCEHGGNRIPAAYRSLFAGRRAMLQSHRGYDAGALALARGLATALQASLVTSTVSRLLVDLNRSIGHPHVFSAMTRELPAALRARIVEQHYRPYRTRVEQFVSRSVAQGRRAVHLSSHSFTPTLDGEVRRADVGLLYNPVRPGESALCARWKATLGSVAPEFRVRRNYPYAGKNDGLTAYLRTRFGVDEYVGIEVEINQRIVHVAGGRWTALRRALVDSLRVACAAPGSRDLA